MIASSNPLSIDLIPKRDLSSFIRVQGGTMYYSNKFLNRYNVSDDVQKVRRSNYLKGKSKNYRFNKEVTENKQQLFFYDTSTIPPTSFSQYGLPTVEECSIFFSKDFQIKVKLEESPLEEKVRPIAAMLESALDRAYRYEYLFYRNEFFKTNSQLLSQKYAVLDSIKGYMNNPVPKTIKLISRVLQTAKFSHLGFPIKRSSFYSYLDRASKAEDLVKFTLGHLNVNDNARKINNVVAELICYYAGHANGVPANKVRIWVNVMLIAFPKINGGKTLEIRRIETFMLENDTKIQIYRHGEDFIRKRVAAYLHMHSALNPFDQFFMDEWYLELVCKKSNKCIRKIVVGMMDGCSRKMVVNRKVESLNSEVIKSFLHDTVVACRDRMSAELICDFASYNVCKEISRMLNYLKFKYKERFAWTVTSNANRKVELERFWETMGSYYISPHVGSTGQGITAKRDKATPAKVIQVFINDPAFIDSETEVDRFVDHIFDMYNKKGIHIGLDSPNEIFRDNKAINAIPLEPVDLAFMFGVKNKRKLIRSELLVGKPFQTFEASTHLHYEKMVDCYTYERFPDSLFAFQEDSMELIGEFKYYEPIPKAKVNQTESDRERLSCLYVQRENMVEDLLGMKKEGIDIIKSQTNGVDPGEVGMFLIDQTLPQAATSVAHLNPLAADKIGINPWDLPEKKPFKKASRAKNSNKVTPISSSGLFADNLKEKYA